MDMPVPNELNVLADAVFRPRAIALLGATPDQKKNNSRAQRVLKKNGYQGRIIPINPGRTEIMGDTAYPDIRAAPGPIDHAFIMVPAAAVPDAIAGCVEKGVKVATIYSAGFAEIGPEGRAMQEAFTETARRGGLRLIGPNCLGLVNVTDGVPITNNAAVEAEDIKAGSIGVASQSGSMMGALLSRAMARGHRFSKLVSVGNECDVGVGEVAQLLVEDEATRCVLLFMETLRDAPKLAAAAARAHQLGKPIIAYKLGRSDLGRRIAVSHTGAMVGADELAATFFREHGILRVETLEALVEAPRLVLGRTPPRGRRVSIITGTGGGAAMIVDRLGLYGDELVGPTPAMQENLSAQGIHLSDSPLIDLPMGGGTGQYTAVLKEMVASDGNDAVVAVLGSTARLRPTQVNENILDIYDGTKPIAVFCAPQADEALRICDEADVAGFRTPESCADALHAFLNWRAPVARGVGAPEAMAKASALLAAAPSSTLDEAEAGAVFQALGIEGPGARVVEKPEDVRGIEGPVAVKILSPDILHKTDAGLVRLGVVSEGAIRDAVAELTARAKQHFPQARLRGALVAPMHKGLAEVILGFRRDPEVGPIVMLGMGGVLAELRKSFTVRLAPVSVETAAEMIAELPELRMLTGFRNLPRGDVAALARAIHAISLLAATDGPTVQEAEINPLFIRREGEGVVAVDGLIILG
ncbi:acetate--CoA ligase family protein [Rhodovarius lipocyclicus]|uniref:acetate--CoA ligase family protein n=1 Tax=Rhodovarius lipocyclicus TaxID=268410 RepID=UPI001357C632|nr:acetate--CoA ligase family protein [Rhodovarius lipocyclicus]